MRTAWLIGVGLMALTLVFPAQAQERFGEGRGERPRSRRDRGPRGPMSPEMVIQRLPQVLELTEEQQEQFDDIAARYTEQWSDRAAQREQMRELARQYREARQAGDDERATEIREQMRQSRGEPGRIMNEFLDEVGTILTEEQGEKLNRFRERFRRMMGPDRNRGMRFFEMMHRLPEELELTDEQRAQYDELMAEFRGNMEQMRKQWQELAPLRQALREAREAGDEERIAEILEQLEANRPAPPDPEAFLAKLEPILTDEQKAKLAELKSRWGSGRARETRDVREVLSAAKRLDLKPEQRERLKEIIRETTLTREQGRMDRQAKAELAETVKKQILEMLDANQANEFERMLERQDRRERHREGHGNRERPGWEDQP